MSVVTDRKRGFKTLVSSLQYDYYLPAVLSASDYYAFGMEMPGRTFSAGTYRYGFNGKENDRGNFGLQLVQDYGMRLYNPALGKFLSVDPIAKQYPELTPYQFASNTPIQAIDLDGLEAWVAYKNILMDGTTKIQLMFDDKLQPIQGVYQVAKWWDDKGNYTALNISQKPYSAFPKEFPNKGKYSRDDKKDLLTLELGGQLLFGEIAGKIDNLGFEFGAEGNLAKIEYASEKGWGLSSFIAKDNEKGDNLIKEDKDLKLGAGVGIEYLGVEYRRGMNGKTGQLGDHFLEVDGPLTKFDVNATKKDGSIKFGLPEAKLSLGVGVKGWVNGSFNPQPTLTEFEKTEKQALKTLPKGTKTTPDH
jgi:RHS repeat-associated protein